MAKIVTVINFKGGVGKTTISVEIATSLARFYGKRTLLVDLDPQASATFYVMKQDEWLKRKNEHGSTYDVFSQHSRSFSIRKAIVKDVVQGKAAVIGLDLLPSNPELVDVDLSLSEFKGYNVLLNHFEQIRNEYDYVICDCPPTFNPITKNALWASNAYVVPTVPDFLSTYGIGLLQRSVEKLLTSTNYATAFKGPVLGGILLTRVKHTNVHEYYCNQVQFDYRGKVFNHMIKDSIAVAAAADERTPISALNPPKGPAIDLQEQFQGVAGEFISRIHHLRS
ncbi:MAG TPA: ParA family protein [Ktedonobacteraceae bacterium]|nr:ParA family protein [Ktedonobacteraceae bacterium]